MSLGKLGGCKWKCNVNIGVKGVGCEVGRTGSISGPGLSENRSELSGSIKGEERFRNVEFVRLSKSMLFWVKNATWTCWWIPAFRGT